MKINSVSEITDEQMKLISGLTENDAKELLESGSKQTYIDVCDTLTLISRSGVRLSLDLLRFIFYHNKWDNSGQPVRPF